jgi:catechol 2,3-dioxygenase-like lactoylglutathione lyase family enzyme
VHLNHIHVSLRDLSAALAWFREVWLLNPEFQNERMATFAFGDFILILDSAETDSPATIGFESEDCDRDFRAVVERGAVAIEAPNDKAWGVRSAYLQGPGCLKFEIEQPLK